MVSLTRAVPYEKIKEQLKKNDRIAVITCNTCPRFCGSGGVEKMEELSSKLRKDGFIVTDQIVLAAACINDYIVNTRLSGRLTAAVVLACDAGWSSIKQHLKDKNVVKGTETIGLVVVDREKGVEKLMLAYEDHKDELGNEYHLLTGELQDKKLIDMEVKK